MSAQDHGTQTPPRSDDERFTTYETNKVPWYIHAMWMTFAIAGILYLLRYALSDFLRWW